MPEFNKMLIINELQRHLGERVLPEEPNFSNISDCTADSDVSRSTAARKKKPAEKRVFSAGLRGMPGGAI